MSTPTPPLTLPGSYSTGTEPFGRLVRRSTSQCEIETPSHSAGANDSYNMFITMQI